MNIDYHPNHIQALKNPFLDSKDFNAGWTSFGNWYSGLDCGNCQKNLEQLVLGYMKEQKAVNTEFLGKCYKAILTVPDAHPINTLNFVMNQYEKKFGTELIIGKFGGSHHEGERVFILYASSKKQARKRLEEIKEVIEENNVIGKLGIVNACDFILYHLQINKKTKIRQPEVLLKRMKG